MTSGFAQALALVVGVLRREHGGPTGCRVAVEDPGGRASVR